jgi:hypothetical protein
LSSSWIASVFIGSWKLAGREWFVDHFTCADAYFYWCFRRGAQFHPDALKFEHCTRHMARMDERASVKKLLVFEAQVQAEFAQKESHEFIDKHHYFVGYAGYHLKPTSW